MEEKREDDNVEEQVQTFEHSAITTAELADNSSEYAGVNWGLTLITAFIVSGIAFFVTNLFVSAYDSSWPLISTLIAFPYVFFIAWLISYIQPKSERSVLSIVMFWLMGASIFAGVIYVKISASAAMIGFLIAGVVFTPIVLVLWAFNSNKKVFVSRTEKDDKFVELENMSANGGAVGAMVLGLWSVIGALITSWSFINGFLGVMLGLWGLASKRPWFAIVGIVLSAVGALMCMVDISGSIAEYFSPVEEVDF